MNITLLDRAILESLNNKEQSMSQLQESLGVHREILKCSLTELLAIGIVKSNEKKYKLNISNIDNIKSILNSTNQIQNELLDFFQTYTRSKNLSSLKMKKIHITESEEKILNGLLYNVESFIKSLEQDKNKNLKEQKIIFWGETKYENIINDYINN